MKGSLIILGCFAAGCVAGRLWGTTDIPMHDVSLWLLYLLMLQAGVSVGSNPQAGAAFRAASPRLVLLPAVIVGGAVIASAVASLLLRWSAGQCAAVGSACGYYSLSSILIGQLTVPDLGASLAGELATVALLANIMRELFGVVGAPLTVRFLGPSAEIAAAGVTSVDVCLPSIMRNCGESWLPAAILTGILIDLAAPFLITALLAL